MNTTDVVNYLREVQQVLQKYIGKTDKIISSLQKNDFSENFERDVCEYIFNITSKHYKLEKDVMLTSNKRGITTEARKMCFALMKEHLSFSDAEIGDYFCGRSRQLINRELSSLPLNQSEFITKQEAKFVQDFLKLSVEVVHCKKLLQQKD